MTLGWGKVELLQVRPELCEVEQQGVSGVTVKSICAQLFETNRFKRLTQCLAKPLSPSDQCLLRTIRLYRIASDNVNAPLTVEPPARIRLAGTYRCCDL
jgi:hypothetical protein